MHKKKFGNFAFYNWDESFEFFWQTKELGVFCLTSVVKYCQIWSHNRSSNTLYVLNSLNSFIKKIDTKITTWSLLDSRKVVWLETTIQFKFKMLNQNIYIKIQTIKIFT